MPQPEAIAARSRLVRELSEAFRGRAAVADADALAGMDRELLGRIATLEANVRPEVRRRVLRTPPRRVASAMAMALHSQPHLGVTYGAIDRAGSTPIEELEPWHVDGALVMSSEQMERSLGLSRWQVDELREEVDRRAGRDMKQARALQWMWAHFALDRSGSTWSLFRVLFPGVSGRLGQAELVRRGAQLYAVLDEEPPPLSSLYLPWLPHDPERDLMPLTTFRSRYVDLGLRRAIARAIGADAAEVSELLDHMVCIVPWEGAERFLELDQWRSRGLATLTSLASPYSSADWLVEPVRDEELDWSTWLGVRDGELEILDEPRLLFDTLASGRVQAALQQVYAAMLARLHPSRTVGPALDLEDVPLFDVGRHLDAALARLLEWPTRPDVHQQVAAALDMRVEPVAERLLELAEAWETQAQGSWLALPTPERPHTVHAIVLSHLVALFASLRQLTWEAPDPRWDHRATLLLFAGHYLAEARVERLWIKNMSDGELDPHSPVPPPEDVVGTWFWGCWTRVLDAIEGEAESTLSY